MFNYGMCSHLNFGSLQFMFELTQFLLCIWLQHAILVIFKTLVCMLARYFCLIEHFYNAYADPAYYFHYTSINMSPFTINFCDGIILKITNSVQVNITIQTITADFKSRKYFCEQSLSFHVYLFVKAGRGQTCGSFVNKFWTYFNETF